MGNMSYCRFENTDQDLGDCMDYLDVDGLSVSGMHARDRLIEKCKEIAEMYRED